MNETQSESVPQPVESTQATGIARRRLLRAGLAAGPVVLALSGRSAMACTGSTPPKGLSAAAWASFEANGGCAAKSFSVPVKQYALCGTPNTWNPKKNPGCVKNWPSRYCVPFSQIKKVSYGYIYSNQIPSCNPNDIDVNHEGGTDGGWRSGTTLYDVLQRGSRTSISYLLMADPNSLDAHICAAYLNLRTNPEYALSLQDIKDVCDRKIGSKRNCSDDECKRFLAQTMG